MFLLTVVMSWRFRWVWFLLFTIVFVAFGQAFVWWWFPHHVAPVVPLVLCALAVTMNLVTERSQAGPRRFAPVILAGLAVLHAATDLERPVIAAESRPTRGDVMRRLEQQPGPHLVFVRYEGEVSIDEEWVWNAPDLRTADVIFAHDLGPARNPALVSEFAGRTVWMITVAGADVRVEAYSAHP